MSEFHQLRKHRELLHVQSTIILPKFGSYERLADCTMEYAVSDRQAIVPNPQQYYRQSPSQLSKLLMRPGAYSKRHALLKPATTPALISNPT